MTHALSRLMATLAVSAWRLAVLAAGIWCALALWYRLPGGWHGVAAGSFALLAVVVLVVDLSRFRAWTRIAFLLAIAAIGIWWSGIAPSNHRDWQPDVARTVTGTVEGARATLHNVRNFDWKSDTDMAQRWEDRHYDLDQLSSVDLFLSEWGDPGIAHTLISFGFSDGAYVVFSIEIRKETGEAYDPLAGFFKQYEIAYIAADERDIVRVRTDVRGEDVHRYRVLLPPDKRRELFLSYIANANERAREPQFYNTLTANCTTLVFDMVRVLVPGLPLDWRIILSAYLPGYLYDHGGLATDRPLDELKREAAISSRAIAADGAADFSAAIRR